MIISRFDLESSEALAGAISQSFRESIVIFKHSTRCSISSMALSRLEQGGVDVPFFYLDVIRFRPLSNAIAEKLAVTHESPQLLLLHGGECVYEASHLEISSAELREQLERLNTTAAE